MNSKIWLSSPHMGGNERQFVTKTFDSNWIAPLGANVDGFEKDIENFLDNDSHVAVLSAGTAALHLALILLNVQKDDEVICQSMTFSASANPIRYLQAIPIFVDSERDTWNINPDILENTIKDRIAKGNKPKAIIPVHLYGMPAKMLEIMKIAERYGIPIIEDAAEALGSSINNTKCGTFGEIAILSFNGNKIITTSSGGAMISKNEDYIKKATFLATQARDPAPHYQHSEIGYNYRLSNVCAAIGRGQMEVLPERISQRRANFSFYNKALTGFPGISFVEEPEGYFSNRWLTTILVDPSQTGGVTRENIRLALEKENIESRPLWKPMHLQPVFQQFPYYGGKVAEDLFDKGLCLPSGSNLSAEDLERVVKIMKSIL